MNRFIHRLRRGHVTAILVVLLPLSLATPAAALSITQQVDLGDVEPGSTIERMISITNDTNNDVRFEFVSSDRALTITPQDIVIAAGAKTEVRIVYVAPEDLTGKLVRIVTVLPAGHEPLATVIRGQGPEAVEPAVNLTDANLTIDIYMDSTCPKCRALVDDTIPGILEPGTFILNEYDILVPEYVDEMMAHLSRAGRDLAELPVAFVTADVVDPRGSNGDPIVLQGFTGIESGIAVLAADGAGLAGSDQSTAGTGASGYLTIGAIVGAGLLDGINPCAFSTMLFLISMLALAGRSRREILVIGIVYSLTVFVGYVAAGFGLFAGVRTLMVFPVLVTIMRWTLFSLLIVLAGLSIRDAVLAGQGRTSEMSLQLPDRFKRRVHNVVRAGTRSASLVGGTVLLGIGVTVFEFSCTGQVYVPVIMHLARTGSGTAVGLLLLYNLAFIVPLLIVFALAYAGVSMKKVGNLFAGKLVLVKLGLAIVFAGFAALTVLV